jgi:hypothetical protein
MRLSKISDLEVHIEVLKNHAIVEYYMIEEADMHCKPAQVEFELGYLCMAKL